MNNEVSAFVKVFLFKSGFSTLYFTNCIKWSIPAAYESPQPPDRNLIRCYRDIWQLTERTRKGGRTPPLAYSNKTYLHEDGKSPFQCWQSRQQCKGATGYVVSWSGCWVCKSSMQIFPSGKIRQAVHQLCVLFSMCICLWRTHSQNITQYTWKYKFLIFMVNPIMNTSQFRFQVTRGNPLQNLKHMIYLSYLSSTFSF